ncbi:glycosyltransferase [Nonlabens ulvanivorans]|uniref:Glycosyltransferase 2-like domain-containing protein n=1 Tax=Nonlabens ulvanivorans TaxID=906888 RepID=A0A090QV78_NONUL|nr:glycosyltransferase [Nonlabens ulvanivorans]GAK99351.1 hypothetical protein JCM19314_3396 [Nonlabens ulvanivorans]
MREGTNNTKGVKVDYSHTNHRIIIPFYISNGTDFYSDSIKILELCLLSLKRHSVYNHKVTLICNGNRNNAVENKITALYQNDLIQELLFFPEAIGKVNAILKVLRDIPEYYVTITDGDVFFKTKWDKEVMDVFKNHPKAGAVSPIPIMRSHSGYTMNIWSDYLFSNKLQFKKPEDALGLEHFSKSIGWPHLPEHFKNWILMVTNNDHNAVVGHSHFCATYKTTVFNALPDDQPIYLLGNNSMFPFLDRPTTLCDGYRLATAQTNGYHLGNTFVDDQDLYALHTQQECVEIPVHDHKMRVKPISYFIKFKLFSKLMRTKWFKKKFYTSKGLPSEQLDNFM